MITNFDAEISAQRLSELAPDMVDTLRKFVIYGLCRQKNTFERKWLAEKFAELAIEANKKFPELKLAHVGAQTIITKEPS